MLGSLWNAITGTGFARESICVPANLAAQLLPTYPRQMDFHTDEAADPPSTLRRPCDQLIFSFAFITQVRHLVQIDLRFSYFFML